jgi:hypothetical protein
VQGFSGIAIASHIEWVACLTSSPLTVLVLCLLANRNEPVAEESTLNLETRVAV